MTKNRQFFANIFANGKKNIFKNSSQGAPRATNNTSQMLFSDQRSNFERQREDLH